MRIGSTMMALVRDAGAQAGADTAVPAYLCDGGDVTPDGRGGFRCDPYLGFGRDDWARIRDDRDASRPDDADRSAIGRQYHDGRGLLRSDPSDTEYDDPLCNPDLRDASTRDCPWRQ